MPCLGSTAHKTKQCADEETQRTQKCTEEQDQGYDDCARSEDRGHDECCDWWPCSWACDAFVWIANVVCVAWTWVSNVVCVAWSWIEKAVCVSWTYVTTVLCASWDALTAVVNAIIETVESTLGWFADIAAWIWAWILTIPILGALLGAIWNGLLSLWWAFVSIADAIIGILGIRPEKKLRICPVVLCDEQDQPIIPLADAATLLQNAVDVWREQANVRIIPSAPFKYRTGYGDAETVDTGWLRRYCPRGGTELLDLYCGGASTGDLATEMGGIVASKIQFVATTECFYGTFRRLVGYGAPVVVLFTRAVHGDPNSSSTFDSPTDADYGCSFGPLTNYVSIGRIPPYSLTLGTAGARTVAHELGHACSLWHVALGSNLMEKGGSAVGTHLTPWQAVLARASRHITYF